MLRDVAQIVSDRHQEGTLSGLEQDLIQLSLFQYTSQMLSLEQDRRAMENDWKISMGIDTDCDIILSTEIGFQAVRLDMDIDSLVPVHPLIRSFERRESATQKAIRLEKSRILPAFEVSGGYKEAGENFRGAVVGLSFPLPLLNWNRPQVEKESINLQQIAMKKNVTLNTLTAHIRQSIQAVEDNAQILEQFGDLETIHKSLESSTVAYSEGWISLNDLLNNIQIYAESIDRYYDRLISYYQHLFFLEAALDRVLVTLQ
jgi:outer membrane protein TolC